MSVGIDLGVNIDHVATLRQARRVSYPSPIEAALAAEQAGAAGTFRTPTSKRCDRCCERA